MKKIVWTIFHICRLTNNKNVKKGDYKNGKTKYLSYW